MPITAASRHMAEPPEAAAALFTSAQTAAARCTIAAGNLRYIKTGPRRLWLFFYLFFSQLALFVIPAEMGSNTAADLQLRTECRTPGPAPGPAPGPSVAFFLCLPVFAAELRNLSYLCCKYIKMFAPWKRLI